MKSKRFLNSDQNEILKFINNLQIKDDKHPFFQKGIWPSYRYSRLFNFHVPDNNIFFSLSIAILLKNITNQSSQENATVEKINLKLQDQLEEYRNKDGKISYNFWRTKPSQHFPYGKVCRHFDYWRLPDDLDDTSLALLFKHRNKEELNDFVFLCSEHANLNKKAIQKIDSDYKEFPAFSTFFGINMPIEFDVVVLSNALSVFFEYKLELSREAEASLDLIYCMLKNDYLLEKPFRAAPNYARTSIIYYHLAKLIYFYPNESLNKIKELVRNDLRKIKISDPFDNILIAISKLFMGLDEKLVNTDDFNPKDNHPFFIAGMFSAFESKLFQNYANKSFSHIKFNCEAYNYSLIYLYMNLLENKML